MAAWGLSVDARSAPMLVLAGELDMQSAPALEEKLADTLLGDGPVVIDVSNLRFIDSTGIRAIVGAVEARPAGCVILHGVRGGVANVFQIADLSGIPRVHIEVCDQPSSAT